MAAMGVHLRYSKEKKMQGLDSNNWEKRKTRNQSIIIISPRGLEIRQSSNRTRNGDFYSWWREKKKSGKKKSKNGSTHREKGTKNV